MTNPEQDRYIRLLHLRNRFRPASRTARETPGDIIRGSAVQQLGAVYANVRSGVDGRFAAIFLLRFAVVEGYCGHNSVLTGFRGVKIPFYSPTNPDFASTALTDGRAFGVRSANDTRIVVYAKQIGGADQVLWYGPVSLLTTGPL